LALGGGQATPKAMGVVPAEQPGITLCSFLFFVFWFFFLQRSLFLVSFASFSHPFIKFKDKNKFFTARNKFVTATAKKKKKKKCKPR
jgi:hypothetical protein